MEASAGGVKKLWKAAGDAPVESFATRGEGGPAKVKVTPGVVRAVLPAELDAGDGDDCQNTGARLATDIEISSSPDRVLFEISILSSTVVESPEQAVLHLVAGDVTFGIEFASKWGCGDVRKAIEQQVAALIACSSAEPESKGVPLSPASGVSAIAPLPSAVWQYIPRSHIYGARVGSLPLQQRMRVLLSASIRAEAVHHAG
ncbi:hypothetical protein DIPPA_09703 [Diplonema papillatum]|nr:hypothetical protein DIPPA_09703 [Diplonema papillatum]